MSTCAALVIAGGSLVVSAMSLTVTYHVRHQRDVRMAREGSVLWYVRWGEPVEDNITRVGPFTLSVAYSVAASLELTLRQYTNIVDAEGNPPT